MASEARHGIEQLKKDADLHDQDELRRRLEAWLGARWPQCAQISAGGFSIPTQGISNSMIVFDLHWREGEQARRGCFVARLEPEDEPVAPRFSDRHRNSVALEFELHSAIARHSACPVATLVGLELSPDVLGRPFYLMQHVTGRVPPSQGPNVDSFLVHEATPAQRRRLVESGLDALIAMHRLDWRAAGLEWLDPSGGGRYTLAPQIEAYRAAALRHLRGADHPILLSTLDWLRSHEPADLQPALAWGDSRPGNILFNDDYSVAAALDWEMGAIMPRDSDLALWLLADFMVHESEGATRLPGYPTRAEQLAYYERHYGERIRDLAYWELFAAMKIAYVFVRVVRRMQDKGVMPAGEDGLIFDNFAVRYLRERAGQTQSTLLA